MGRERAISTDWDPQGEELAAEQERQRQLNARVHRQLGTGAAVLGLGAAAVAVARFPAVFGISPWEGLRIGLSGRPLVWMLVILGLGVLFSLGTARLMTTLERWWKRGRREKAE